MSSELDPELLAILACPLCEDRPALELQESCLLCPKCGSRYPIEDGIPRLLPEDAIPPSESGV